MADEDDQWLYGDSNPEPPGTEGTLPGLEPFRRPPDIEDTNGTSEEPAPPGEEEEPLPPEEEMEEGGEGAEDAPEENGNAEAEGEGSQEEGDEEEDSDDDNVNVVIGDISKAAPTYTNLNVHKRGGLVPAAKGLEGKFSMEEFESVGVINGVSAVEYNIEVIEDKPWRKPGADITDYFNYGFNEDTWKAYCDRQKRIRVNESGVGLPTNVGSGTVLVHPTVINTMQQNTQPKRYESSGQIHVVASRRHDLTDQPPPMNPMHLPPMAMPPPGFPNMQQPFQQPPPFFPSGPGPDYSDNYEQQWRPDSWQPSNLITPGANDMPPPKGEGFPDNFERFPPDQRERENEPDDRHRDDRDRDRDRERGDRDRERDREREERDRRDRHRRSRSRSHGRERSRARSRSRSPSHKKHKKKSKKSEKSDKKKRSDDSE